MNNSLFYLLFKMACGVFHKASKGFWSKVKGVFGRIGNGIKNVAKKAFKFATGAVEKFGPVAGAAISTAYTGDPTSGAKIGGIASNIAGGLNKLVT